jgi:hypothetical protein
LSAIVATTIVVNATESTARASAFAAGGAPSSLARALSLPSLPDVLGGLG